MESSSNSFIIDTTAPLFVQSLSLSPVGSIVSHTSVLRSLLRVQWEVEDKESFIESQLLSILSHTGGDFNSSAIKVKNESPSFHNSNKESVMRLNILYLDILPICKLRKISNYQNTKK